MGMTEIKVIREDEKATAILKAIRQIDNGAELEPVVRCKGCKHFGIYSEKSTAGRCWAIGLMRTTSDFCSLGEKVSDK